MHHHVRCYKNPQNIHSDMARLARVLMAQTVGLVLGGGGAKGAAHLGILAQIQVCSNLNTLILVLRFFKMVE